MHFLKEHFRRKKKNSNCERWTRNLKKKMQYFNAAFFFLLAEQGQEMLTQTEDVRAKLMKAKYLKKNKNFLQCKKPRMPPLLGSIFLIIYTLLENV